MVEKILMAFLIFFIVNIIFISNKKIQEHPPPHTDPVFFQLFPFTGAERQ